MLCGGRWGSRLLLLGALALAGCAEAELVAHTAKTIQGPSESGQIGAYKVGKPYQIGGVWYYPKVDYEYQETGIASWYGPGFDGKRTANGEIFDRNLVTGAHRTLPLPSMVQVTNLENGRSLKVRLNDRGPFAHGRIIDLSERAAKLLGFDRQGTAKVRVEIVEGDSRRLAATAMGEGGPAPKAAPAGVVSASPIDSQSADGGRVQAAAAPPRPAPEADGLVTNQAVGRSDIFVQAGAFLRYDNANRLSARLSPLGPTRVAAADVDGRRYYRVQLGPVSTVSDADRLLQRLIDNGHYGAQVVVVQ